MRFTVFFKRFKRHGSYHDPGGELVKLADRSDPSFDDAGEVVRPEEVFGSDIYIVGYEEIRDFVQAYKAVVSRAIGGWAML